jgi:hypothetical protein
MDVPPPPDDKTLVIEDDNADFYYLKDLPPNFRDICARLFDMVVSKSNIIFSTYMYLENHRKSQYYVELEWGDMLEVPSNQSWDHHIVNEQEAEMQCYFVDDIR